MSLLLAVPHDGTWLLMADSCIEFGSLYGPPYQTIARRGDWLVGTVGDTADAHA